MRVRVDLDRRDGKYYYGQAATMSVSVTNDGGAPTVVHRVEVRILAGEWRKISLSRRVGRGESEHLADERFTVGLWTGGRGALFEARVLCTTQEAPPAWSGEQEGFDQGSFDVGPAPPNGKKIFISHSNKDMDLVAGAAKALRLFGFAPYVAEEHAKPGENLWDKIAENMADSDAALVLLTKNGTASYDVREEIGCAQMRRRLERKDRAFEIIPVVTDTKDADRIGGSLAGREYVRMDTGKEDGGMGDLVSAVRAALGLADAEG